MRGRKKTVLGVFVDGLDIKLASLSVKGKKVTVHELKSGTLVSKLEERKMVEAAVAEGADAFSLPAVPVPEPGSDGQSEDNNAVMLGLLADYPAGKYSLTYAVAEPAIYYHLFESDFGLKGAKLKERILAELRNVRAFQPAPDAVDTIRTDEGNLLCVVREDGLSLVNLVENIKGFIGNRIPHLPLIDSADVALMNMVRMNYDLQPDEVSVVIYVGVEFTRLIFMKGRHFYQFAPILAEGYDSAGLQNTVYSRLLLEQDNLAIPQVHRIILAGEARRVGFRDFLIQQLPGQEVEYLLAPRLDTSLLPFEQQESVSEYAVPLGVAWRALEESEDVYAVNLLPASIREGQRIFKLAWHGYLMMALLFLTTLFFTLSVGEKQRAIQAARGTLTLKERQQAENRTMMASIEELQTQLAQFNSSLALYDSLTPGSDRWSRVFARLSHGVEDLNSIWITDFTSTESGEVTLGGFTTYRTRIPRMATLFESSVLREVSVQEIREETVYRYKVEVPAQAPATKTPM